MDHAAVLQFSVFLSEINRVKSVERADTARKVWQISDKGNILSIYIKKILKKKPMREELYKHTGISFFL